MRIVTVTFRQLLCSLLNVQCSFDTVQSLCTCVTVRMHVFYSSNPLLTAALSSFSRPKGMDSLGPLEFSDIFPGNKYLYDKMRPPKYKGELRKVVVHTHTMRT